MAETSIEWCDVVWNVTRGCSRVSAGCGGPGRIGGCYAERQAMRFSGPGQPYEGLVRQTANGPRWTGRVELIPSKLDEPLHWRRPRRVFVNSMSDLFHEALSSDAIAAVFGIMACNPRHTFQILTKRPERMREWILGMQEHHRQHMSRALFFRVANYPRALDVPFGWPLPNVWLGVSLEDQKTADERIPLLLQTPAAVRFVSYEPALGPVDFRSWLLSVGGITSRGIAGSPRLDQIIVGGESGPNARPFDVAWARSVIRQCREAGVAAFCKQVGANIRDRNDAGFEGDTPHSWPMDTRHEDIDQGYQGAEVRIRLRNPKGGDPSEWPEDLRVREFPKKASHEAL